MKDGTGSVRDALDIRISDRSDRHFGRIWVLGNNTFPGVTPSLVRKLRPSSFLLLFPCLGSSAPVYRHLFTEVNRDMSTYVSRRSGPRLSLYYKQVSKKFLANEEGK